MKAMYKRTILFIALIISILSARADDSIKVSSGDLKALMQRIERLEQAEQNRQKLGYTDATTGASRQVPKDTVKTDTAKIDNSKPQMKNLK